EIVLGVALPVILPLFFGLNGILYSMPLADILTFLITVAVILSIYRSLKQEETQLNAVRL
ncbi:MAG: MATE family efflux transporter, partial [Erysipelotrichaceae bacterium]|nr:MATE family efflux transporter [Erysipelotrichaceae bacterium]